MADSYIALLSELAADGKAFTVKTATISRPGSRYLGPPTTEWQVWQARVMDAIGRRFKEKSPPSELISEALELGFEGNYPDQVERKKGFLVGALEVAKALILDQEKMGEKTPPDSGAAETGLNRRLAKTSPSGSGGQNVFIVHGHDEDMKLNVARTVEKLGLTPIILHEQPNLGRTIIEKIHDYSDVGFAIVLLSPDDMGHAKDGGQPRPRARQNVILELGFFLGLLGRERVLALFRQDPDFEMPTDYSGVLFKPYDLSGGWKIALCGELQAVGLKVDANRIL